MIDVAVIDDPAAAEAALEPGRARLLAQLTEPRSVFPGRRSTITCGRWSTTGS